MKVFELPKDILKEYLDKHIPFSIAEELVRLKEFGESDSSLRWWENRFIIDRIKIPEFKKGVRKYIQEKIDNQGKDLLDVMGQVAEKLAQRMHIKKVVAENLVYDMHLQKKYWDTLFALWEEGKIEVDDAPYSEKSPRKILEATIEQIETKILGHLQKIASRKKLTKTKKVLAGLRYSLNVMNEEAEFESRKKK